MTRPTDESPRFVTVAVGAVFVVLDMRDRRAVPPVPETVSRAIDRSLDSLQWRWLLRRARKNSGGVAVSTANGPDER